MRARDHHPIRTAIAVLGTLPAAWLAGAAVARWLPGPGDAGLVIGLYLPYLLWPGAVLVVLCAPTPRRAAAWTAAATCLLSPAVWW